MPGSRANSDGGTFSLFKIHGACRRANDCVCHPHHELYAT